MQPSSASSASAGETKTSSPVPLSAKITATTEEGTAWGQKNGGAGGSDINESSGGSFSGETKSNNFGMEKKKKRT